MKNNNERKTINDISRELGLSKGTISKIINNNGRVSAETRKRVLKYIEEVGFVPIMNARNLRNKKSYTIGIVFAEESNIGLEHHFFSTILNHFKTYVEEKGYDISFIVRKKGDVTLSYLDWCKSKQVDGVYIVVGNYDDEGLKQLIDSHIPCVSNDMFVNGLTTVVSDNDQGTKIALEYVKDKLRKESVGLILGPSTSKAFEERRHSFLKYTKDFGLNVFEGSVIHAESFGFTSGYNAIIDYCKSGKQLPDVFLVGSDDICLGVLRGLHELSIDVPNEIQLIGFDDIPYASRVTPALTTIKQDLNTLGTTAASILIDKIEEHGFETDEVIRIPTTLIVRETTKEG